MAFLVVKNIIYNCKQATLLIIKKKEQRLSIVEKVRLFVHLLFCDPCKRFVKQSEIIDHSLHNCEEMLFEHPVYTLPEEFRKKIQHQLEEER
jgi:hypothetical protein